MPKNKDIVKIDGVPMKKEAFMLEENHPAIGRMIIVDGNKFKILDDLTGVHNKSGTFIKKMTEEDEERIREYDEALEELSEKLVNKLDIKRLIKENIKTKPLQDIKTGLFILKAEEDGEEIEEEHLKGCYNYRMHKGSQTFEFMSGDDILHDFQPL